MACNGGCPRTARTAARLHPTPRSPHTPFHITPAKTRQDIVAAAEPRGDSPCSATQEKRLVLQIPETPAAAGTVSVCCTTGGGPPRRGCRAVARSYDYPRALLHLRQGKHGVCVCWGTGQGGGGMRSSTGGRGHRAPADRNGGAASLAQRTHRLVATPTVSAGDWQQVGHLPGPPAGWLLRAVSPASSPKATHWHWHWHCVFWGCRAGAGGQAGEGRGKGGGRVGGPGPPFMAQEPPKPPPPSHVALAPPPPAGRPWTAWGSADTAAGAC